MRLPSRIGAVCESMPRGFMTYVHPTLPCLVTGHGGMRRWKVMAAILGVALTPLSVPMKSFGAGEEPSSVRVGEMALLSAIAMEGPAALAEYIHANSVEAPAIHSQWYVDRIAATNLAAAKVAQADREFGRAVAKTLEDYAPRLRRKADWAVLETETEDLLGLADWLGESVGYGNSFLVMRLHDLATVPIAYLVTDMSFPEEKVEGMIARLVGWPEDACSNVPAMNLESGSKLFHVNPHIGSTVGILHPLERGKVQMRKIWPIERVWNIKYNEIRKWKNRTGWEGDLWPLPRGRDLREAVPDELAYFVVDDGPEHQPRTTLNLWDCTCHWALHITPNGHNISNVRETLLFRQIIGGFPVEPPIPWESLREHYKTPVQMAFSLAWDPYRTGRHGEEYFNVNLDAAAYLVFSAIQKDEFCDEDTRITDLWKALGSMHPNMEDVKREKLSKRIAFLMDGLGIAPPTDKLAASVTVPYGLPSVDHLCGLRVRRLSVSLPSDETGDGESAHLAFEDDDGRIVAVSDIIRSTSPESALQSLVNGLEFLSLPQEMWQQLYRMTSDFGDICIADKNFDHAQGKFAVDGSGVHFLRGCISVSIHATVGEMDVRSIALALEQILVGAKGIRSKVSDPVGNQRR